MGFYFNNIHFVLYGSLIFGIIASCLCGLSYLVGVSAMIRLIRIRSTEILISSLRVSPILLWLSRWGVTIPATQKEGYCNLPSVRNIGGVTPACKTAPNKGYHTRLCNLFLSISPIQIFSFSSYPCTISYEMPLFL